MGMCVHGVCMYICVFCVYVCAVCVIHVLCVVCAACVHLSPAASQTAVVQLRGAGMSCGRPVADTDRSQSQAALSGLLLSVFSVLTPVFATTYVSQEPPGMFHVQRWLSHIKHVAGVVSSSRLVLREAVPTGAGWNWEWQLRVNSRSLSVFWLMGFSLKMQDKQVPLR